MTITGTSTESVSEPLLYIERPRLSPRSLQPLPGLRSRTQPFSLAVTSRGDHIRPPDREWGRLVAPSVLTSAIPSSPQEIRQSRKPHLCSRGIYSHRTREFAPVAARRYQVPIPDSFDKPGYTWWVSSSTPISNRSPSNSPSSNSLSANAAGSVSSRGSPIFSRSACGDQRSANFGANANNACQR